MSYTYSQDLEVELSELLFPKKSTTMSQYMDYLYNSVYIPAVFLHYSGYIPAVFLHYSGYIPAVFVCIAAIVVFKKIGTLIFTDFRKWKSTSKQTHSAVKKRDDNSQSDFSSIQDKNKLLLKKCVSNSEVSSTKLTNVKTHGTKSHTTSDPKPLTTKVETLHAVCLTKEKAVKSTKGMASAKCTQVKSFMSCISIQCSSKVKTRKRKSSRTKKSNTAKTEVSSAHYLHPTVGKVNLLSEESVYKAKAVKVIGDDKENPVEGDEPGVKHMDLELTGLPVCVKKGNLKGVSERAKGIQTEARGILKEVKGYPNEVLRSIFSKTRSKKSSKRDYGAAAQCTCDITALSKLVPETFGAKSVSQEMAPPELKAIDPPSTDIKAKTKKSGKRAKVVTSVGELKKEVVTKNSGRLDNKALVVKGPLAIEKKDPLAIEKKDPLAIEKKDPLTIEKRDPLTTEKKDPMRKSKSDKTCALAPVVPSTVTGTDRSKSDKSEVAKKVIVDPREAVRKEEAMFRLYKYFGENDFAACKRGNTSLSSHKGSEVTNRHIPFSRTLSTKSHEKIHMVESLYALNEESISKRGKAPPQKVGRAASPTIKSISPKSCRAREKLIMESPREHSRGSRGTRTTVTDHLDTNSGITIIASEKRERINIDNWARGTPSAIEWSRVNETLKTMSGKSLDGGRSRKKSHTKKTTCSSTEFHPELEKFILESENPIKTTLLLCNSGITTKYEQLNSGEPQGIGSVMSRKKRPKSEVFPTLSSFLNHIEQEEKKRLELKGSSPKSPGKKNEVPTKREQLQDAVDTEKPANDRVEKDDHNMPVGEPNIIPQEKDTKVKDVNKIETKFHFGLPPLTHHHHHLYGQGSKNTVEKTLPPQTSLKTNSPIKKPLIDAPLFAHPKKKLFQVRAPVPPVNPEKTEAATNKVNRKKLAVKFDVRNWKKGVLKNMKRDLDAKVMKKKNPCSDSIAPDKMPPKSDTKTMDLDIDSIVPPIRIRNGGTGANTEAHAAPQSEKSGEHEEKRSIDSVKYDRSEKESSPKEMSSVRQDVHVDKIFDQKKIKNDFKRKTAMDLGRAMKKRAFPEFYKNEFDLPESSFAGSTPQEAMTSSGHTIKKFEEVFLATDKSSCPKKSLSPSRKICTEFAYKTTPPGDENEPIADSITEKRRNKNSEYLLTGHRLDTDIQIKQTDARVTAVPDRQTGSLSPDKIKRPNESPALPSKGEHLPRVESARREGLVAVAAAVNHEMPGADVSRLESPSKVAKKTVPLNVSGDSVLLLESARSCRPQTPRLKKNVQKSPEIQIHEVEKLERRESNPKKNNETQTGTCLVSEEGSVKIAIKSPPKIMLRAAAYTHEMSGRRESLTPSPDITSLLQRSKMILKQARFKKLEVEKSAKQNETIQTTPVVITSPRKLVSSSETNEKMLPSERKPPTPIPVVTSVMKMENDPSKVKDNPLSPSSWNIDSKTNESFASNPSKKSQFEASLVSDKVGEQGSAKKGLQYSRKAPVYRSKICGKFQRDVLASKTAETLNKSESELNKVNIPARSSKSSLRRKKSILAMAKNNETSRRTTIRGSPAYVYSRLTSLAQYDLLNEQKHVKYVLESAGSEPIKKTVIPKGPKLCTALRARGKEPESIKVTCRRKISSYDDIRKALKPKRSVEVAVSQSEKKFPQNAFESKSFTKLCIKPNRAHTSFTKLTSGDRRPRETVDLKQMAQKDSSEQKPEVADEGQKVRLIKNLPVIRKSKHKLNLVRRKNISCTNLMKISSEAALSSEIVCVLRRPEMKPSTTSELRGVSKSAGYSQDTFCEIADGQCLSGVIKDKTSPGAPTRRPLPSEGGIHASQAASNLHEASEATQKHGINRFISEETVTPKTADCVVKKLSLTRISTERASDGKNNVFTIPSCSKERSPSRASSPDTKHAGNTTRRAACDPSVKPSHSMTTVKSKEKANDKSQKSPPILKSAPTKTVKVSDDFPCPRVASQREATLTKEIHPKEKCLIKREKSEIKDSQSAFLATLKKSPPIFRAKTPESPKVKKELGIFMCKPVMESIKELQEQCSDSMSSDLKSLTRIEIKERHFSDFSDAHSSTERPKIDLLTMSDMDEPPKHFVEAHVQQKVSPPCPDVGMASFKNNYLTDNVQFDERTLQKPAIKPCHQVHTVASFTGNCSVSDKEKQTNSFTEIDLFQDTPPLTKEQQDPVVTDKRAPNHLNIKSETHSSFLHHRESLPDDTNKSVGSESLLSERLSKGKQNKNLDEISEGRSSMDNFKGETNVGCGKSKFYQEHILNDKNGELNALVDVITIGLLQESMKSITPMRSADEACGYQGGTVSVDRVSITEGEAGNNIEVSITHNRVKQSCEHGPESESPTSGYSTMKVDPLLGAKQSSTGDDKVNEMTRGFISPSVLKDLLGNTIEEAINAAVGMFTQSHGHQMRQTDGQRRSETKSPAGHPSESSESGVKQVRFCNVQPTDVPAANGVSSLQDAVSEDVRVSIKIEDEKPPEVPEQELSFIQHEENLKMNAPSVTECPQLSLAKTENSEHNSFSLTCHSQDELNEIGAGKLCYFNTSQSRVSSQLNSSESRINSHVNNSPSKVFSDHISQADDTTASHVHSETFHTFNLLSLPDQMTSVDTERAKTQRTEKSPARKPQLPADAKPETTHQQSRAGETLSVKADKGTVAAPPVILIKSSLQRLLFTAEIVPPAVPRVLSEKVSHEPAVATPELETIKFETKDEVISEKSKMVNCLNISGGSTGACAVNDKTTEENLKTRIEGSHSQSEVQSDHTDIQASASEHTKFTRTRKRTFVATCPSILGKVPKIARPESESRTKTKNILKELARKLISKRALDEQNRLSGKSRFTSQRNIAAIKADSRSFNRKLSEERDDNVNPPLEETQTANETKLDNDCRVVEETIQQRRYFSRANGARNLKLSARSNCPEHVLKMKNENGLHKNQEMSSAENDRDGASERSKEDLEAILNSELTKIDPHTDHRSRTNTNLLFSTGGEKLVRGGRRIRKATSLTISPLMTRHSRENIGPTPKPSYASMMSVQNSKSGSDSRMTRLEDFLQKMDTGVVNRGPMSIISRSSKLSSITSATKSSEEDEQLQALLEKPVKRRRRSSHRTKSIVESERADREPVGASRHTSRDKNKPQSDNDLDLRSWNANNDTVGEGMKRLGGSGRVNYVLPVKDEDLSATNTSDQAMKPKKQLTSRDKDPKVASHVSGDERLKEGDNPLDLNVKISEMFLTQSAIDTINAENESTGHLDSGQEPGYVKDSSGSSGSSSSIVLSWIGSDTLEGDDIFINAESLSMDSKSYSNAARHDVPPNPTRHDVTTTARDRMKGRDLSDVDVQDISEILNENVYDLSNADNSCFLEDVGARRKSKIPTKRKVTRSTGGDVSMSDLSNLSHFEQGTRPNISNSARKVSAVSLIDSNLKMKRNDRDRARLRPGDVAAHLLKNVNPISTGSPVFNYPQRFSSPSSFRGDDSWGHSNLEQQSSDNENEAQSSLYSNNPSCDTWEQQSYFDSFLKDPKWNQPFQIPDPEDSEAVKQIGSSGGDFGKVVSCQVNGCSSKCVAITDAGPSNFCDRQIKIPSSRDSGTGAGQCHSGTKGRTFSERKRPLSGEHTKTPPTRGDVRSRTNRTQKNTGVYGERSLAESQKTLSKSSFESRSRYSGEGKIDRQRHPLSNIGVAQTLKGTAARVHTGSMTLEQHLQSTSKVSVQRAKGNKSLEMHLSTGSVSQRNAESTSCGNNRESKTETAKSTSSQASFNWYKPQSVPSSTSVSNSQHCSQDTAGKPSSQRVDCTPENRESRNAHLRAANDSTCVTVNRKCTPTGSNTTNTENLSSANSISSQVGRPKMERMQSQPIANNPQPTYERLPATTVLDVTTTHPPNGNPRLPSSRAFTAAALNKSTPRRSSDVVPKKVSTIVRMFEQKKEG